VPFVDPLAIARDPRIDLVVELVGGRDGIAKQVVEAALQAGKLVGDRQQGLAGASWQRSVGIGQPAGPDPGL
jgi:hypothetical protein